MYSNQIKRAKSRASIASGVLVLLIASLAPTSADAASSLSDLIVTLDDISAMEFGFSGFTYTDKIVWTADRTEELEGYCPVDCVKTIWHVDETSYLPDGYRWLTISMIEMTSEEQAEYAVHSLFNQFADPNNPHFWDHTSYLDVVDLDLPDHTRVVYDRSFAVMTSLGPVVLLISLRLYGFHDIDDTTYVFEVSRLAKLQLQKLAAAGYP